MNGKLRESYKNLKPSVVAIAKKTSKNPYFPEIIGTGFFVREDGIIATNDHVIKKINELQKEEGKNEKVVDTVVAVYFEMAEKGMQTVPLLVDGVTKIRQNVPSGPHYGPDQFDLGFLVLKDVADCPVVEFSMDDLHEGANVAVSGFPMGTRTLMAEGWVHQLGPTLQSGVIGAVLPFECKTPHGILIDVSVLGGSSGSPIFDPDTGKVLGIVYGGLNEMYGGKGYCNAEGLVYKVPTSLTLGIPSWFIKKALDALSGHAEIEKLKASKVPLHDWMKSLKVNVRKDKFDHMLDPVKPTQ